MNMCVSGHDLQAGQEAVREWWNLADATPGRRPVPIDDARAFLNPSPPCRPTVREVVLLAGPKMTLLAFRVVVRLPLLSSVPFPVGLVASQLLVILKGGESSVVTSGVSTLRPPQRAVVRAEAAAVNARGRSRSRASLRPWSRPTRWPVALRYGPQPPPSSGSMLAKKDSSSRREI